MLIGSCSNWLEGMLLSLSNTREKAIEPLQLPENCIDITGLKIGTIVQQSSIDLAFARFRSDEVPQMADLGLPDPMERNSFSALLLSLYLSRHQFRSSGNLVGRFSAYLDKAR
jgi:hypothetical protein